MTPIFDWIILIFGALLILSGSISLITSKKSLSRMEKFKLFIEIIGVILGIFFVLIANIPDLWKIGIITVVVIVGLIFMLHNYLTIRSPVVRRKKTKLTEQLEPVVLPACDAEILSRNELLKTSDLISRANNEICFIGLTLETLRQVTESIENALRRNVDIRVLLPKRDSDLPNRMEKVVVTADIAKDINRTIDALSLRDAQPPLTPEQKRRLRVKEHGEIPSYSMILIDSSADQSRYIHIEPYPLRISSERRKIFVSSKNTAKQKEIAELYWSAFNNLWQAENSAIVMI